MQRSCIAIDMEALRRLYVEELYMTDQLAAHFGCSAATIWAALAAIWNSGSAPRAISRTAQA